MTIRLIQSVGIGWNKLKWGVIGLSSQSEMIKNMQKEFKVDFDILRKAENQNKPQERVHTKIYLNFNYNKDMEIAKYT